VRERDGNTDLLGLDVITTTAATNSGCTIGPTSAEPQKEVGTRAGPPMAFMATNRVAEMGGKARAFGQWKVG
jgi:hypothetical protein